MGVLGRFWGKPHVEMYSKYMIFQSIPCNILLWGCESWALRQYLLDTLEVFLHRKIRHILGINMTKVRNMRIKNTSIRIILYNIPYIWDQVLFRKLTSVGKILRRKWSHLPTQLLTAWCNHPRKRGRPLLTKNMSLDRNLCLIIPDVDKTGFLPFWGYHALNTGHWRDLLATLKNPSNTTPVDPPNTLDANTDVPPHSNSESFTPTHATTAPPAPSATSSTLYVKILSDTRRAGRT